MKISNDLVQLTTISFIKNEITGKANAWQTGFLGQKRFGLSLDGIKHGWGISRKNTFSVRIYGIIVTKNTLIIYLTTFLFARTERATMTFSVSGPAWTTCFLCDDNGSRSEPCDRMYKVHSGLYIDCFYDPVSQDPRINCFRWEFELGHALLTWFFQMLQDGRRRRIMRLSLGVTIMSHAFLIFIHFIARRTWCAFLPKWNL